MRTIFPSDHWINVTVSKGMFSDEYAVKFKLYNGETVSFFAHKNLVKKENSKYKLRVYLVGKNKITKKVLLPVETFQTGSRWAEISVAL